MQSLKDAVARVTDKKESEKLFSMLVACRFRKVCGRGTMINIAVIEDNEKERETLVGYLKKFSPKFSIECFSSAVIFLTDYKPKYNIVFMDIDMPCLDGMSAAARMRKLDDRTCIIFVTNLAKYAIKGYEVQAFDFIVKPLTYANFAMKLTRALNHLKTKTEKEILVKSGMETARIAVGDIKYVEIRVHKLTYHLVDKDIFSYGTLKDAEALIEDKLFVRCNTCFLVNLRFVDAIKDNCAVVGGDNLLISYPRRAEFKKTLTDYLCGEK